MTLVYHCTNCGLPKQRDHLQPSTDARDRWRLGVCVCSTTDKKGNRGLRMFSAQPALVKKVKWGHGDGATQWCEECKDIGAECGDPKPAPNSMLCYCGHNISKR